MANTIIAPNYAKHPVLIKRVRAASTAAAAARLFWGIPNAAAAVCFSQVVPGKYLFRPNPCRRGCFPLKHHSSTLIVFLSLSLSWAIFFTSSTGRISILPRIILPAGAFSQGQRASIEMSKCAKGTVHPKSDRFCVWNLPGERWVRMCLCVRWLARWAGAYKGSLLLFLDSMLLLAASERETVKFPRKAHAAVNESRFCRFPLRV